jgi:hypothetical protein
MLILIFYTWHIQKWKHFTQSLFSSCTLFQNSDHCGGGEQIVLGLPDLSSKLSGLGSKPRIFVFLSLNWWAVATPCNQCSLAHLYNQLFYLLNKTSWPKEGSQLVSLPLPGWHMHNSYRNYVGSTPILLVVPRGQVIFTVSLHLQRCFNTMGLGIMSITPFVFMTVIWYKLSEIESAKGKTCHGGF